MPLRWCGPESPAHHLGTSGKVSSGATHLLVPLCHVLEQAALPEVTLKIKLQQVTLACKSKSIVNSQPWSRFFTVVKALMNLSRTVAVLSQII